MPNLNRVLFGLGAVFGIAALVGVLIFVHTRAVSKYGNERYEAGKADAYAAVARKSKQVSDTQTARAEVQRNGNSAENRNIAADVSDLRVRGPGNAVCHSSIPAAPAASGHVEAVGSADAAVDTLSSTERPALITMPYLSALAFAGQCDADRDEVKRWRAQHEENK